MPGGPRHTRLLCGTHMSARESYIDGLVRENWGRVFLLVPTRAYAARRSEQILTEGALDGAWGRPVQALSDFASFLLCKNGQHPVLLKDIERRLFLEQALHAVQSDPAIERVGLAARTNGFVSHALRIITELKQAAVDPDEFRARIGQCAKKSFLDDVLAKLYAGYQDQLLASGLFDLPGLFWQANLLCREKKPIALDGIDTLILDGFDDFTPSEFRLIASLEQYVDLLVFGLSYDPNPGRQDAFSVPARTARAIQERFSATFEHFEEKTPETFTEFAAANIFWRDKPPAPDHLEADLEVLPCADFTQEIENIGRRIKQLLLEGKTEIDEIAVVYRNVQDAAGPLRTIFAEMGIPVRVIQNPALWESAVCSFLLRLFEAMDSWTRAAVVDVLTSPWFQPPGYKKGHADVFPVLSRVAQIVSGYDEWRARLSGLAGRIKTDVRRLSDDPGSSPLPGASLPGARLAPGRGELPGPEDEVLLARLPEPAAAIGEMLDGLEIVNTLAGLLPEKATPAEFAAALKEIISRIGVEEAINGFPDEAIRENEREAFASLHKLLAQLHLVGNYDAPVPSETRNPKPETRNPSWSDFFSLFRQALHDTPFRARRETHAVACLDAESARHLRFDYVFFAGVNEGQVPRPPASNAIYSEDDLERLAAAGIPIEGKRVHNRREMALFHHMLNVARKKLCISWRRFSRQGKEEYPSPYISDLLELFPSPRSLQSRSQVQLGNEGGGGNEPCSHAFVPPLEGAACWRDIRNALFLAKAAIPEPCPPQLEWAAAGAEVEARRDARGPFDAYDGALAEPDTVGFVAGKYGADHLFSVKQIETYAECPFQFLVERILKLEEAETPVAEFDARVRGVIMHDALEQFHGHYRGRAADEVPYDEAAALLRALVARIFKETAWRSKTAPMGVEKVEQRRLEGALCRYLKIEQERHENEWKPEHFEVAFGRARHDSNESLSTDTPYPLTTPAGEVLFSGRIDRVDLSAAGEARIIDYKTSTTIAQKDIAEGRSLQLSIYALALDEFLMKGTPCAEAYFLTVGKKARIEGLGHKNNSWKEREAIARQSVATCVERIRAGYFPPVPSNKACAYCTAAKACRHEAARIERKTGKP